MAFKIRRELLFIEAFDKSNASIKLSPEPKFNVKQNYNIDFVFIFSPNKNILHYFSKKNIIFRIAKSSTEEYV